jgi:uncharacterized glyoxalase superfamily protein PhnB
MSSAQTGGTMSAREVTSNIYPGLTYDDPAAAIEWLCRAFGFEKRLVVPGPDGSVMHSELSYGPGVVMIGSPRPEHGRASPTQLGGVSQVLTVRVADPDAHCRRAVDAGATIVVGLRDAEYGSRGYLAKDPEGHLWYFGTYLPGAHWSEQPDGRTGLT